MELKEFFLLQNSMWTELKERDFGTCFFVKCCFTDAAETLALALWSRSLWENFFHASVGLELL